MSEIFMRVFVGLMMFAFFLCGIGLVKASIRELYLKLMRFRFLRRAQGYVVEVHKERNFITPDGEKSLQDPYFFYPTIQFTNAKNESVSFRSEVGEGGRYSKYKVGQAIVVRYDPENIIKPMIDSWLTIWGMPLMQILGGVMFVGGSVIIYLCFGGKIFGY